MKLVVYAPANNSGGAWVMDKLLRELRKRGLDVEEELKREGYYRDRIAIYPEVIHGNPYYAKHCVRYILNTPGAFGHDSTPTWRDEDLIIGYSDQFTCQREYAMKMMIIDDYLLKRVEPSKNKSGTVYIRHKSDHEFNGRFLDVECKGNPMAVAQGLANAEKLVCFDPATFYIPLAKALGCEVEVANNNFDPSSNPFYTMTRSEMLDYCDGDMQRQIDDFVKLLHERYAST